MFRIGLKLNECLCFLIILEPVLSTSFHPIAVIFMTLIGVAGRRSRPIQLGLPRFLGRSLDELEWTASGRTFPLDR